MKILCFTWNAQAVRLSEQIGAGTQPASWRTFQYKRYDADFVPALLACLKKEQYDFFFCAMQEAPKPGSHFLSDALPSCLREQCDMDCVHRVRMLGVGKTTLQNFKDRGELVARGLRSALYVRRSSPFARSLTVDEGRWTCEGIDALTHGKGATAIVVRVPLLAKSIAFMNCHLPFDSQTIEGSNEQRMLQGVARQAHSLQSLVDRCIVDHRPNYLFVAGDLNFRVLNRGGGVDARSLCELMQQSENARLGVYRARDELRQAIDYGALYPFREGVANRGPTFMPTGKMQHGRPSGSTETSAFALGKRNHRNPSWCDRILYARADDLSSFKKTSESEKRLQIECLFYERFEHGQTMVRSDHSAVIGSFAFISSSSSPPKAEEEKEEEEEEEDDEEKEIETFALLSPAFSQQQTAVTFSTFSAQSKLVEKLKEDIEANTDATNVSSSSPSVPIRLASCTIELLPDCGDINASVPLALCSSDCLEVIKEEKESNNGTRNDNGVVGRAGQDSAGTSSNSSNSSTSTRSSSRESRESRESGRATTSATTNQCATTTTTTTKQSREGRAEGTTSSSAEGTEENNTRSREEDESNEE